MATGRNRWRRGGKAGKLLLPLAAALLLTACQSAGFGSLPAEGGSAVSLPNGGVVTWEAEGQVAVAVCLNRDQVRDLIALTSQGPSTVEEVLDAVFADQGNWREQAELPETVRSALVDEPTGEEYRAIRDAGGYILLQMAFDPNTGELAEEPAFSGWEDHMDYVLPEHAGEHFSWAAQPEEDSGAAVGESGPNAPLTEAEAEEEIQRRVEEQMHEIVLPQLEAQGAMDQQETYRQILESEIRAEVYREYGMAG